MIGIILRYSISVCLAVIGFALLIGGITQIGLDELLLCLSGVILLLDAYAVFAQTEWLGILWVVTVIGCFVFGLYYSILFLAIYVPFSTVLQHPELLFSSVLRWLPFIIALLFTYLLRPALKK